MRLVPFRFGSGAGACLAAGVPLPSGWRALGPAWRRCASRVNAAFVRLRGGYRRWRSTQRIRRELASLDDATLRDLGLYRDEIESVAAEMTSAADRTRVRVLISI